MTTALNFKSKKGYKKYLAFGHIHKVFEKTPGNTPIKIAGKTHKVKHSIARLMLHAKIARGMDARA